jgi:hypothetical protein
MLSDLQLFGWMLFVGGIAVAVPLAWSKLRPRPRRRIVAMRETDPNDAYTC